MRGAPPRTPLLAAIGGLGIRGLGIGGLGIGGLGIDAPAGAPGPERRARLVRPLLRLRAAEAAP
ncbi:hypothetical protein [Streptomyces sp. ADI98-10]|uniref:hypothetical protein n=1 Tax=Streptomyces sp. ADI98-10 TaxID=1522763 RepID=UPI000F54F6EC|nr:hypothetical protein [Streptomyces sp. ADI98-10]RPK93932.1 hypothetical protein EES46_04020 [Streptomyces sp. ADI98-10]